MTMPDWSQVKHGLKEVPRAGLLALVKELFELSPENRSFLAARFLAGRDSGLTEGYRQRVTDPFYPKRGFGKLKFDGVRRAIREYEKATGDSRGVIDLVLMFVESGPEFTNEFGDIDQRFYDVAESMLWEATGRLAGPDGKPLYPGFEERLRDLVRAARGIGWGFGDGVKAAVAELEAAMRPAEEARAEEGSG